MSDRVRIGLAGLGRLGRYHAENLAWRTPLVELVRVMDVVEPVARSIGERLAVPWSTSFDDLLADPRVEAVVIATPTPFHAAMVEQAAAAGKHIFCEKPIAFELQPTLRAIEAARSAGVKLQIGFHRRFDPDWAAVKRRLTAGELGDVYIYRSSLRDQQPPSLDYLKGCGGFFVDTTIHDFDCARWLIGEIDELSAFGAALAVPAIADLGDFDQSIVVLRFANGALGVIDNSRSAGYGYEASTEVVGSLATARIGFHRRVNVEWLTPGAATRDHVEDFVERFPRAYLLEMEAFARAVGDDQPVEVTGEDGLAAYVLSEAAWRSVRERRPIPIHRRHEPNGRVIYELNQ
jgi:myo-inositol 2-dehydrogenase/D-chiro-inositol 1-dehydrogenase